MKVVEINVVPYGSTGMIANEIKKICIDEKNCDSYFCYSWTKKRKRKVKENELLIGTFFGKVSHMILSRITGNELSYSYIDTLLFIKKLKKINPDVVHLHILHSWYINVPLLFKYFYENDIKVVWTFHDCWAFTGHCPHFEMANCFKWKLNCNNCPIYNEYPMSFFDNSEKMYNFKKKWFTYLKKENLYVVTPSKWLANYASNSFMKKYSINVINNGIDLNVFRPLVSDFRNRYNCQNKIIVLGVALDWGKRKGLDIFINLSKDLSPKYQIVLVGTTDKIDQSLPSNIISIHKTQNREELVKIYSAADVFVNPTREDTFPTVNIESIACGTPVIAFNTGGCPEIINEKCGFIVEKNNYNELKNCIENNKDIKNKFTNNCVEEAKQFDAKLKYLEYYNFFKKICKK